MKKNIYIILLLGLSSFMSAQPMDTLYKIAVEQNTELRTLHLEYEAALTKANQVNELPNPQVGVGLPLLQTETRVGSQIFSVSASQMFPWFGTLKAKEDIAITMAKSKYERMAVLKLDLQYKIRKPYYKLVEIEKLQLIFKENIRLYKSLEQVALAKVETGKAIASDVLLVHLKIQDLENKIALLENQKLGLYALINEVLNRKQNEKIEVNKSLDEIANFKLDKNEIRKKIANSHPIMSQLNWLIETSKEEQNLNALLRKPTFGLGLDYTWIQKRNDIDPSDNGKDILIPKVSITIPLFTQKYDAKDREEDLKQQSLLSKKESLVNKYMYQIERYEVNYQAAILNLGLYKKQIQVTQSAIDILLSNYSSKGIRFDEILNLQNQLLKYKLLKLAAIYETHLAKIELEKIVGF